MKQLPDLGLSAPVALLREALASVSSDQIPLALGYDSSGDPIILDLAAIPHLLIAGGDGVGLPNMLHSLLASVLLEATPATCRLILIDPTGLEFGIYADIPHLLSPIADAPAEGMRLLRWVSAELNARYSQLAAARVRNIAAYSRRRETDPSLPAMPHVVCVISQYEDLRMLDEGEFDRLLVRLAQKARAIGIHLVLGASRPESVPSLMRANLASRILLSTDSRLAARAVLGSLPSTPLPRTGEFLFHDGRQTTAVQRAASVPSDDLEAIADHWRAQGRPDYLPQNAFAPAIDDDQGPPDGDGLYSRAVSLVFEHQRASASWLQRELRIGYNSAARLIEQMEESGILSSPTVTGRRKILVTPGGFEVETEDYGSEFVSKGPPSKVYFKDHDFWQAPAKREKIDKKYTVEEILSIIDVSAPTDAGGRASFLTRLRSGLDERLPSAHPFTSDGVVLPTEPPERYQGLRGPETPPVFVQRVYGEWLGHGLSRAHIRQLDPTLYQAIVNWTRKPENEWPADVDLPTLKEQNTRWADRVGKDGIMSAVDGLSGQEAVREARRLTNLRHRRSKEQQQR